MRSNEDSNINAALEQSVILDNRESGMGAQVPSFFLELHLLY